MQGVRYDSKPSQDGEKDKKKKKTRIDVYETLCPQQMLVHKGGKIKNWGGECRVVKIQKKNYFFLGGGVGGVGGSVGGVGLGGGVRVDVNEVFVKIQKKIFFGGGGRWVGGSVGGVGLGGGSGWM